MSRKQLEAALASARATVAALEAALENTYEKDPAELLDLKAIKAEFGNGYGRDALLAAQARDGLKLTRGPRNKIQVERNEFEAWRRSRRNEPTERRPVADLEAWKAQAKRSLEVGS